MPINKNADTRYQVLDRCFSDFKRKYTIEDLLDKVNDVLFDREGTEINLRQLRSDISYMRDRQTWNAPIKAYPFEGKKCYYRYENADFSIFNNELSEEEVRNLRSTLNVLKKYRGIPANAWLEEVISNLEYRFGGSSTTKALVSFSQNEDLKGLEHLSDIIDATINSQPLSITYRTFGDDERDYVLHPYYMKQYNERWFLFGYNETEKKISTLALDRIIGVSNTNVEFRKNTTIDFDSYFRDIVGVSVPNPEKQPKKELVKLQFSKKRFPYVVTKPLHRTQEVVDEQQCIISINVIPTRELSQQILSYGNDVEVIEPDTVRKEISAIIAESYKKYFPVQEDCTDDSDLCIVNPNKGGEMNVSF